jgi:hypothetical protein
MAWKDPVGTRVEDSGKIPVTKMMKATGYFSARNARRSTTNIGMKCGVTTTVDDFEEIGMEFKIEGSNNYAEVRFKDSEEVECSICSRGGNAIAIGRREGGNSMVLTRGDLSQLISLLRTFSRGGLGLLIIAALSSHTHAPQDLSDDDLFWFLQNSRFVHDPQTLTVEAAKWENLQRNLIANLQRHMIL